MNHLVLFELFNSNHIEPELFDEKHYTDNDLHVYRYKFITPKGIHYIILLQITKQRAEIHFYAHAKGPGAMVNNNEIGIVMNCVEKVMRKHKDEYNRLVISSNERRIDFFKRILSRIDYLEVDKLLPYWIELRRI